MSKSHVGVDLQCDSRGNAHSLLPTQSHSSTQNFSVICIRHMFFLPVRCVKLGDAAYLALAQHCTGLQELRLYASLPSARAIQAFSALKHLQLLDICGAHQATGKRITQRSTHPIQLNDACLQHG